ERTESALMLHSSTASRIDDRAQSSEDLSVNPVPRPWLPIALAVVSVVAGATVVRNATAAPELLPDSTVAEEWTLGTGVRAATRSIPGCPSIAIAVAYRAGTERDPATTPGFVKTMAEIQMTAAAGDVPERTRAELESVRPLGWSVAAERDFCELSEI